MTLRLLPLTTRESERSKNGEAAQSPHDIFFVEETKNNTPSKSQVHTRERRESEWEQANPWSFVLGCFCCWSPGRLSRSRVRGASASERGCRKLAGSWSQSGGFWSTDGKRRRRLHLPCPLLCCAPRAAACLALSSLSLVPACPPPATARAALDGETKALSYIPLILFQNAVLQYNMSVNMKRLLQKI